MPVGRMTHSACGYYGPALYNGECPECRHRIIAETLVPGQVYTCQLVTGFHLGDVELIKLEKAYDGRYNGLALIRPLRVRIGHQYGKPVYRDSTEKDITHVGTKTLKELKG